MQFKIIEADEEQINELAAEHWRFAAVLPPDDSLSRTRILMEKPS